MICNIQQEAEIEGDIMQRKIDRLDPLQKAIAKTHLAAAGISIDSLDSKPLVAVVNSWNEICPGHEPLAKLAEDVKKGILEAGGEPIEFNTVAMCDGIAQGHSGMKYCLPHREIISDSIEAMIVGEGIFDGMVLMGACDKILPGMLNAAARIDIPSIVVTSGPCFAQIKPSESKKLRRDFLDGKITERQLVEGTLKYYTGGGVCPFMGTANTMACLCEALGMMLPGSSLIPSGTSLRRSSARLSGKKIVELIENGIKPTDILTAKALRNAGVILSGLGGSLNALIHLPALAYELGLSITWADIADISDKVPVVTQIVPNGDRTVIDLHNAGGIPAVMKELSGWLCLDVMTVTGSSLRESIEPFTNNNKDIIYELNDARAKTDGIQVLYGNIAKEGAIVKTSAVPEGFKSFSGPARVFDCEEDCYKAFKDHNIAEGDVIVIRYEGPSGGPGMREMHRVTEIMNGMKRAALITDGRLSGASAGLSICCVCPEAQTGRGLAVLRTGDRINIDLEHNSVTAELDETQISEREKAVQVPRKKTSSRLLERYSSAVSPANEGAVIR